MKHKSRLIGLTGYKQSGKSTVAALLVEHGWMELSFAEPLKQMLVALDPLIMIDDCPRRLSSALEHWTLEEAKLRYPEVRRLLQRLGTEAGRHVLGPDVWVNLAEAKLRKAREFEWYRGCDKHSFVIPDVRFVNEAEMIHGRGGIVVRIVREGQVSEDSHVSEQPLPDGVVNLTITAACGDVAGLRKQAEELLL